jgi:hypothetical protein
MAEHTKSNEQPIGSLVPLPVQCLNDLWVIEDIDILNRCKNVSAAHRYEMLMSCYLRSKLSIVYKLGIYKMPWNVRYQETFFVLLFNEKLQDPNAFESPSSCIFKIYYHIESMTHCIQKKWD